MVGQQAIADLQIEERHSQVYDQSMRAAETELDLYRDAKASTASQPMGMEGQGH